MHTRHPHDASSDPSTTRLFRWAALVEGSTLLLLVLVAVPVKYLLGEPGLVKAAGPIHGIAFLAYVWALMQAHGARGWSLKRSAVLLFASFIPFGSFFILSRLNMKHARISTP